MSWNNGSMDRQRTAQETRLTEEYRAAGMTEAQIEVILAFDREVLRSDRRFYRHIQQLSPGGAPEDSPEPAEDGSEMPLPGRMDWLAEIENAALAACLGEASPELLEILTLWVFEGWNQREVARLLCCSRQNVTQVLRNFRGRLRRRMAEEAERQE